MRRREWKKAFRILSFLPVPFLVLVIYFILFSGTGEVELAEDEIKDGIEKLPTVEIVSPEHGNLPSLETYTDVVERNVFSSSRKKPSVRYSPSGNSGGGTTNSSDYTLLGVLVTGGNQNSTAVIRKGGKGGNANSYRAGDDIDNMVVEEILYDRVVLRQGDKETILELKPRNEEKTAAPKKLAPAPKNRPRDSQRKMSPNE